MKSVVKNILTYKPEDKFLALNVYQFPFGNCGGVTDNMKTIYIPCKDGNILYKDILDDSKIFICDKRSENYYALKPIQVPIDQSITSSMDGGNLATTSDSRCKHIYHIHDRFENVTKYFDVISPDGFSIHPTDIYSSHDKAKEALKDWISNYERQGYYSSNEDGRIPLKELSGWCRIVPLN